MQMRCNLLKEIAEKKPEKIQALPDSNDSNAYPPDT